MYCIKEIFAVGPNFASRLKKKKDHLVLRKRRKNKSPKGKVIHATDKPLCSAEVTKEKKIEQE